MSDQENIQEPVSASQAPQGDAGEITSRSVDVGRGVGWLGEGFALFKQEPVLWIAIFVVLFLMMGLLGLVPLIGQLAANLIWPALIAGIMAGCAALDDGEDLEFGHLFAGFNENLKPLLGLGLAYLVMAVVMIFIVFVIAGLMGLGLTALDLNPEAVQADDAAPAMLILLAALIMMALMVPVMMATWFAPALIMLSGAGIVESLKLSFIGCLKNILPFLVYGVVLMLLMILAVIPLGLGLLVMVPVGTLSIYAGYRDIYTKE